MVRGPINGGNMATACSVSYSFTANITTSTGPIAAASSEALIRGT